MKKFAIILALLLVAYFVGPSPDKPEYQTALPTVPANAEALENYVMEKEAAFKLKPENDAQIVWADPTKKNKTEVAVVYLHGFSASREEGSPTHRDFAERYGCNLYLARLSDHGIDTEDPLLNLTSDRIWESAKEAYAIGLQLGNEVILMSTSTGGTLAILLASEYDNIKGLINFSPNIEINDPNAFLLNDPWGLQIARLVFGGNYRELDKNADYKKYWDSKYRLEAVVHLQELVETACTDERYERITEPTFNGVYYKNDEEQDEVVRVSAIREMHKKLATPEEQKVLVEFPNARAHVIANGTYSGALEEVQEAIYYFAENILQMPVAPVTIEAQPDSLRLQ